MPTFIVLHGSIKSGGKQHKAGSEIELSAEAAAAINKKGKIVESADLSKAKVKAAADAKAAVEKAEKDAAEKAKLQKGGKP